MNIIETVGMMSTGALLTLGAFHFMGTDTTGQQAAIAATPAATVAAPAPAPVAPAPAPQATRAATDLTSVAPAAEPAAPQSTAVQLASIVEQSMVPLERTTALTPLQLEVIAFFERSARELNVENSANIGSALRFTNMAIDRLNVKYYYQFGRDYDALSPAAVMAEQERMVRENVCNTPSILTLMTDYDFRYRYTYTSFDHKLVGVVEADAATCT